MNKTQSRRDLLLTTLVDLLVQILFVVLVILVVSAPSSVMRDKYQAAVAIERETGKGMPEITEAFRRLVDPDTLSNEQKDNLQLRAEVQRLKAQLEAHNQAIGSLAAENSYFRSRFKALGSPPCWYVQTSNRIEQMLDITIGDDGIRVLATWPKERESEMETIWNFPRQSLGKALAIGEFSNLFRPVLAKSKERDCRHYVALEVATSTVSASKSMRATVENVFYLLSVR